MPKVLEFFHFQNQILAIHCDALWKEHTFSNIQRSNKSSIIFRFRVAHTSTDKVLSFLIWIVPKWIVVTRHTLVLFTSTRFAIT